MNKERISLKFLLYKSLNWKIMYIFSFSDIFNDSFNVATSSFKYKNHRNK